MAGMGKMWLAIAWHRSRPLRGIFEDNWPSFISKKIGNHSKKAVFALFREWRRHGLYNCGSDTGGHGAVNNQGTPKDRIKACNVLETKSKTALGMVYMTLQPVKRQLESLKLQTRCLVHCFWQHHFAKWMKWLTSFRQGTKLNVSIYQFFAFSRGWVEFEEIETARSSFLIFSFSSPWRWLDLWLDEYTSLKELMDGGMEQVKGLILDQLIFHGLVVELAAWCSRGEAWALRDRPSAE